MRGVSLYCATLGRSAVPRKVTQGSFGKDKVSRVGLVSLDLPWIANDPAYMAADVSLGEQIRGARERRHMTQQQLADLLGVDRKTVDNWENRRTSPRNRMGALVEWAPELGGEEPDPNEKALMSLDLDAAELMKLVEAYRAIRDGTSTGPRRKRAG